MRHFLIGIGFLLLVVGCGSDTDSLQSILGSDTAHFRGNSIGNSYKKVLREVVKDGTVQKDENVIFSEIKTEDTEVTVNYEFDQEKLYSIQADIFFADSVKLRKFQQDILERYNSNYGKVSEDGGFLVWKNRNNSGIEVEFTLADESIEFGRPKLSLTIYNFEY